MKTLLLLRHAKSSWEDRSLSDHDRPLNERGERDAPRMGRLLREQGLWPDLILSSTARRARRTAELLVADPDEDTPGEDTPGENTPDEDTPGGDTEIRYLSELYLAEPEDYLAAVRRAGGEAESVLVVGHNPGLEMLLQGLTGEWHRLPTAALARIDLPIEAWTDLEPGGGELAGLWRPKDVS
jgi:phosphohistidine phosphatase